MQGSEAKVVIIPIHKAFNFILNRPWIYTALSRAQDICITIGQFAEIKAAIKKENSSKRITRLKERIGETFRDYQRYQRKVSF
jgi:exodeoxyribonuclease V alpha subunit